MKLIFADICDMVEQIAPIHAACKWDKTGFMIGNPDDEVTSVMTCLDVTSAVIKEAVEKKCNVIISHHPFIYTPIETVDVSMPRGRLLMEVLSNGLNVYSAHTNLDYAERGVNDALAECIGLDKLHWDTAHQHIAGVRGERDVKALCKHISKALDTDIKIIMPDDFEEKRLLRVKENMASHKEGTQRRRDELFVVGISAGAYDGETDWCIEEGIDLLLTGEVKHNEAVDLSYMPFVTVSAGHYATEHCISQRLQEELSKLDVKAIASQNERSPFCTL